MNNYIVLLAVVVVILGVAYSIHQHAKENFDYDDFLTHFGIHPRKGVQPYFNPFVDYKKNRSQ
jgi:hypothetical protein